MERPLISIILPVYGVEQYLEKCIQSLVDQTYTNIEILLVDDGSKDRCPQIIDEWAKKDKRIIPIHKENGGQSSARNLGMDTAKGQYITFVDSDDWVESDYCEKLHHAAKLYDADIIVGSFKRVKDGKNYPAKFFIPSDNMYYPCCRDQAVRYFIEDAVAVWGKMYKTEVLNDIRFPQGRLAEEYAFQLKALKKSNTIAFVNAHLYDYRIRQDSDAHSIKPKYLLDNVQAIDEAYWICKKNFYFEKEFCKRRLASLVYEFTAAEVFGKVVNDANPNVISHAIKTIGGADAILDNIETPLAIIFYTYSQFHQHLTKSERKKLQRDYRSKFSIGMMKQYGKQFFLKYIPAYISLEFAYKLSKLV